VRLLAASALSFLFLPLLSVVAAGQSSDPQRAARVIRRYPAPEASQAVAVDRRFFYAIGNAEIGKYDKRSGERIAGWREGPDGPVKHLNSGLVSGHTLYCAHSNYPDTPMVSSIEEFDTRSMTHVRTIPLPSGYGSATWVERSGRDWWVVFAHYAGRGGEPGKGPEATTLVRFDRHWRPKRSWRFPEEVVRRWDGMSSSGGAWARSLRLHTTGHHAPELYVLDVPRSSPTLELREIIAVESEGQGIALDRGRRLLYSIQRRTREVLVSELPR
jgi:hypothetical protein